MDTQKFIDDYKKLTGRPPYNTGSNIVLNDPYFARYMADKHGIEAEDMHNKYVELTGED